MLREESNVKVTGKLIMLCRVSKFWFDTLGGVLATGAFRLKSPKT